MLVDYVKFSAGSSPLNWGDDISKMSMHIEGALAAYKTERARLKALLLKFGVQALVNDLNAGQDGQ